MPSVSYTAVALQIHLNMSQVPVELFVHSFAHSMSQYLFQPVHNHKSMGLHFDDAAVAAAVAKM